MTSYMGRVMRVDPPVGKQVFSERPISTISASHLGRKKGRTKPADRFLAARHAGGRDEKASTLIGRTQRFNSWDVLLHSGPVLLRTAQAMTTARPLGVIGVTFGMLTVGYWGMKYLTLGMPWRLRATQGRQVRWG